ncbi:hypothetical protein SeLEV6574_g02829 [Synchytrium endobioticum]|uniref:Peptidase M1 membrane alanine aminopeptidase domain-containing protein n=1 Tax=Synchytrium endobioticum TaxID=286115 RepID=A0A507D709_9FUNG|nr:hypothetical protein SeLEV6574_g02829 [Synchytrium endobioticum]
MEGTPTLLLLIACIIYMITASPHHRTYDQSELQSLPRSKHHRLHQRQLGLVNHLLTTTLSYASDAQVATHEFGDQLVYRIVPLVDGKRVIGADTVLLYNQPDREWTYGEIAVDLQSPHSTRLCKKDLQFQLGPQDALIQSRSQASHRVTESAYEPLIEPVYYVHNHHTSHAPRLMSAYRVLDPYEPVLSRKIRYIDAESGDILQSIPTTFRDFAMVYPMPQIVSYKANYGTPPPVVSLPDVSGAPATNGGHGISGKYFRSMNSCFAYKCVPGAGLYGTNKTSTPGACDEDGSLCIDPTSNMIEGVDYNTASWSFTVDGKFIDFDKNWIADGYDQGHLWMSWNTAPVFAPRLKYPQNGIWGSDTNFATYSGTEQNDSFSELETYYLMNLHLSFMRNLANDTSGTFCFFGTGSECSQVDPKSNRTASIFDSPLKFTTNLQNVLFTSPVGSQNPDFFTQLGQGLGKSKASPIVFYEHGDYQDAFYTYSGFAPPNATSEFRDCTDGACLNIFSSIINFFAFGQSRQYDWGLNAFIVFHEMNHAWTQKLIPDLPSFVWTEKGLISDPGAMNEGWSDYFAAIHSNLSDFTKSYTQTPRRTLVNDMTCADTVGEVHVDSQIFTGALWDVRTAIPSISGMSLRDQTLFDQVVLQAQALGQATDTFSTQMKKILTILSTHPRLSAVVSAANASFTRRVFDCERMTSYDETKDTTLFIAGGNSELPSSTPTQLVLSPRQSDFGARISWTQWYISPILGPLSIGYAQTSMRVLISYDCPISLKFVDNTVAGYGQCGNESVASLEWKTTTLSSSNLGEVRTSFTPGSVSKVYIWFFNPTPADMVLYSVALQYEGFSYLWLKTQAAIGYLGVLVWIIYGFHKIISFVKRRESARKTPDVTISMEELTGSSSANFSLQNTATVYGESKPDLRSVASMLQALSLAAIAVISTLVSDGLLYRFKYTTDKVKGVYKTLFLATSVCWMVASLVATPLCLVTTTPAVACGIAYAVYLVSSCVRMVSFVGSQYYY